MVIDVFTFNGETKLLQLHLAVLHDYVDKFIVVEANRTFTGHDKPMYFSRIEQFIKPWLKKVEYYPVTKWDDISLWEQAIKSPNTKGAEHWKREFYIKESIHKALAKQNLKDDDLVLIGDVDEILDPTIAFESEGPFKAKLRVYAYYLNNLSDEQFWGTLVAQYGDIKGKCLNHMRSDKSLYSKGKPLGWHFTSMGGLDEIRRKLNDSYTEQTYNTSDVQRKLEERLKNRQDYIGRPFTFTESTEDWPRYLKENQNLFDKMIL